MRIFISHSRKDARLVSLVKKSIGVVDYNTVIYEDLPEQNKPKPDWNRIKELIRYSDIVFLFITDNVSCSPHTTYWVNHEVSLSSAFERNLITFQRKGKKPELPIGYWTDVVVLDPAEIESVQIQKVAKGFGHEGHPILRAAGGATIGSIFGPVGFALGGLFGLLSTPEDPKNKIPILKCPKCGVQFRFWGSINSGFYCPQCLEFYICKDILYKE